MSFNFNFIQNSEVVKKFKTGFLCGNNRELFLKKQTKKNCNLYIFGKKKKQT